MECLNFGRKFYEVTLAGEVGRGLLGEHHELLLGLESLDVEFSRGVNLQLLKIVLHVQITDLIQDVDLHCVEILLRCHGRYRIGQLRQQSRGTLTVILQLMHLCRDVGLDSLQCCIGIPATVLQHR